MDQGQYASLTNRVPDYRAGTAQGLNARPSESMGLDHDGEFPPPRPRIDVLNESPSGAQETRRNHERTYTGST